MARWNGDERSPLGNPISRGRATWFVLPREFWEPLMALVEDEAVRNQARAFLWG